MNEPKVNINVMPGAQMNGYVKEQHNYFGTVQQIAKSNEPVDEGDIVEAEVVEQPKSQPADTTADRGEEMFHFVHPELDEAEAWRIHDAVKRVVRLQGVQMICQYLVVLKGEKKVLLPPNPSNAYAELIRMGMPGGEGFNETTFRKYYNKPLAPNEK